MSKENVQVETKKKFPIVPIIICVVAIAVIAILVVVAINIVGNMEPKEKVYLTENEVSLIYGSPANYKNKYVKLSAQVYSVSFDKKGQIIRAYVDTENYTNDVVLYYENKSVSVKENDYIIFDGYIKGADKETSKPYIIAKELKVASYLEAITPTTKEVKADLTKTQADVSITVQKVEFSDKETRVYVKVVNNSKYEFDLYTYSSLLTQAGKQYETEYSKNSVEPSSTILAGGSTEGVIVYPKVEQSNFTITMKGYSSNYDIDMDNFVFDISVN